MNKKKTSRKKGRALSTILLIYLPLHMCKVHVWEGGRIKHKVFIREGLEVRARREKITLGRQHSWPEF
jgi:hypothetical protein